MAGLRLSLRPERLFWPLTIALVGFLAVVQVLSIRHESQTWDEHLELASGYSYLKTGEYRIIVEHPPLSRIIQALPLLFLDASLPVDHPSWRKKDLLTFSSEFLYHNRVPADTMLFAARLMSILMTVCLGLAMAVWTRSRFGPGVALFALLLYCFDPTVIANGRYIKHDIPVALFVLLACAAWSAFLRENRIVPLVLAGIFAGLAIVTKFVALFLLPVYILLYVVRRWKEREGLSVSHFIGCFAGVGAIIFLIVLITYAPQIGMIKPIFRGERLRDPSVKMLRDVDQSSVVGKALAWTGARLGLQAHPFLDGVAAFERHADTGHQGYLLGMISKTGWWYYFPVAFAVKTPTATLLALLAAIMLAWGRLGLRAAAFEWYVLLIPITIYLGASMVSKVDIGIRHLLPIYPLLFIAISAAVIGREWKYKNAAVAVLSAGLIIESVSIYPHYLAFFNVVAGGPRHGPRYLLDSNIDWGQDAKNLKDYMVAHGIPRICSCYFGNADLSYYRIEQDEVPATWETAERAKVDCVAAVSVTPLYDLYVPRGRFAWLRSRKPMDMIGYSIYIYDLRKRGASPGNGL